jgi:2-polyprenyl-3-methyl-5-hydroxy-6-metoxy-1,4-benzoquinol methylase
MVVAPIKMENVNNTYFDGFYQEVWRAIIPAGLTEREVAFMLQYFGLKPGDKVLDIMCGYGRHAIALAEKGMVVTAIDNLASYIKEINKTAAKEKLAVTAVRADIIAHELKDEYKLALCMGNSLNFFNAADLLSVLRNICNHLKPGGNLLINTWSLAEIAIKQFAPNSSNSFAGIEFVNQARYLFHPTRIETDSTIIFNDGKKEEKKAIDYIFSVNEFESLLHIAGFKLKIIYSIPGKKQFMLGDPRAYIVAEKPKK